jgi:hypothetical protein
MPGDQFCQAIGPVFESMAACVVGAALAFGEGSPAGAQEFRAHIEINKTVNAKCLAIGSSPIVGPETTNVTATIDPQMLGICDQHPQIREQIPNKCAAGGVKSRVSIQLSTARRAICPIRLKLSKPTFR